MTRVEGTVVRSITLDQYADLTDATLVKWGRDFLEFDGDLTDEQITAVRDRMTSANDAEQAKRAVLRDDRDALAPDDPLRRLYDQVLGE